MVKSYRDDFGPFDGKVWMNAAHQGALPSTAAAAAREAIRWKQSPFELTTERFSAVPEKLRRSLGRLLSVPPQEVVLANSSSYGLHLLANGYPWREGDEVLTVQGDFPSTILPWLGLEPRVRVRRIESKGPVEPRDLEPHITSRTRLFCTTWVHSFQGHAVDVSSLGEFCRSRDITFVLNGSQGVGARVCRLPELPVDAITSVGFKWLCGPYGTGFCWIRPELLRRLEYNQAYWLASQTADDLEKPGEPEPVGDLGARKYDIFGTANFFNFMAWQAALEWLLEIGVEKIEAYDQELVDRFVDRLDLGRYELLSPPSGGLRSTLILLSHRQPDRNRSIYEALRKQGLYIAFRQGRLRISPHLYNTEDEIDRVAESLHRAG